MGENEFLPVSLSVIGRFFLIAPGDLPRDCYSACDLVGGCGEGEKESVFGLVLAGGVIQLIGFK